MCGIAHIFIPNYFFREFIIKMYIHCVKTRFYISGNCSRNWVKNTYKNYTIRCRLKSSTRLFKHKMYNS